MSIETLIERLETAGWKQYRDNLSPAGSETPVYLCKHTDRTDLPQCSCNDKPVQLVLKPFRMMFHDGKRHETWTLSLCAEVHTGTWFDLRAYSISSDALLATLPDAIRRLEAAWQAAATS